MKISIMQGNKKYHFGVELQSHELNLVLRKTAMIVREVPFATRSIMWIKEMKKRTSYVSSGFHLDV